MKRIFFVLLLTCVVNLCHGNDVVVLKNGITIECSISSINNTIISYQENEKSKLSTVSLEEVMFLQIDPKNKSLLRQMRKDFKKIKRGLQVDSCHEGITDANTFHKRAGGNFALGFFFGVFGLIGTAVGNPKMPHYYPIADTSNLSDPTYIQCFSRKAKGKNIGNAAIGWGVSIVLSAILISVNTN